ncbi:MAG: phosphotransferase family protein [Candidatus Magnetomorum sp.]|nr:phosphotransferase family protein [Candidatus Magnetomorum sp.]
MKDCPVDVRNGESLNIKELTQYLKMFISDLGDDLKVKQFPGGYSNLTYLLVSGRQEFVLRRPPVGAKIKSAHDMGREYRILNALRPHFPYCPEALVHCQDHAIIGAPFYVMRRIPGIILRKDLPDGLIFSPLEAKSLCENLLDIHVALHSIDVEGSGLNFLGKPKGYVERQVTGWSERYRNAKTDDAPDYEAVMTWLNEKQPPDTPTPTIVHNDFKFDNAVLDLNNPMKIIGILDWEMATYGDPLMDLGNSLAYWIEKNDPEPIQALRMMPTHMEGALTRNALIDRYAEKTGRDMRGFDFYYCFGLFRLAVIAQQIYQRYQKGLTKDKRFASLIFAVHLLEEAAMNVIKRSSI